MTHKMWMKIKTMRVRTSEFKILTAILFIWVAVVSWCTHVFGASGCSLGVALALFIHASVNDLDDPTFEGFRPLGAQDISYKKAMLPFKSYGCSLCLRMCLIPLYCITVVPIYFLILSATSKWMNVHFPNTITEGQLKFFVGLFTGCFFLTTAKNYIVTSMTGVVSRVTDAMSKMLKGKS